MAYIKLPPGKAIGADDLQKWSSRRFAGRSGVNDGKRNPQPPEIKAARARKRAQKAQEQFDRERAEARNAVLAKIEYQDRHGAEQRRAKVERSIKHREARKNEERK